MYFDEGTEITFHYDAMRSGISRNRRVIVDEMRETGKGIRVMAFPLDSESGRPGPRTFIPALMSDVVEVGTVDAATLERLRQA